MSQHLDIHDCARPDAIGTANLRLTEGGRTLLVLTDGEGPGNDGNDAAAQFQRELCVALGASVPKDMTALMATTRAALDQTRQVMATKDRQDWSFSTGLAMVVGDAVEFRLCGAFALTLLEGTDGTRIVTPRLFLDHSKPLLRPGGQTLRGPPTRHPMGPFVNADGAEFTSAGPLRLAEGQRAILTHAYVGLLTAVRLSRLSDDVGALRDAVNTPDAHSAPTAVFERRSPVKVPAWRLRVLSV